MRQYLRQLNCMVFGHEDETLRAASHPFLVRCALCGDEAPTSMQPPIHAVLFTSDGFARFQEALADTTAAIIAGLIPILAQIEETARVVTGCIEEAIIGRGNPEFPTVHECETLDCLYNGHRPESEWGR